MRRHRMSRNYFLMIALLCLSTLLQAETAEEKGRAIAAESIARDTGWGDMKADMQMILRNKQGEESLREIRIQSLEQQGGGVKSLTIFYKPLLFKFTAFLCFSHAICSDDQSLYLPALKRFKHISSLNKSSPFIRSQFP